MNILHLKYAYEVARLGSVSRAAELLLVAAPNISRSIKELEADLGIRIFDRSSKGMRLTSEGEDFMHRAQSILDQIEEVERIYRDAGSQKQRFSISVPRSSYIADAFAQFSKQLSDDPAQIYYVETDYKTTIENVLSNNYNLGIIRYPKRHDEYYKRLLEEKNLCYELVAELTFCLIMSEDCPLAKKKVVHIEDLKPYIGVGQADVDLSLSPLSNETKEEYYEEVPRRILMFDRISQLNLLVKNPQTFMWMHPMPEEVLKQYHLVQRNYEGETSDFKDMLIYKDGYTLSELDHRFITELCAARRRNFGENGDYTAW